MVLPSGLEPKSCPNLGLITGISRALYQLSYRSIKTNSSVALREANSHGQGIPFDALFKLEPKEEFESSSPVYRTGIIPIYYIGTLLLSV